MADSTNTQRAERVYRRLSRGQLMALRAAFVLDRHDANNDTVRQFCEGRIEVIDRILASDHDADSPKRVMFPDD